MTTAHTPGPSTFSKWEQFGDARFYVAQEEGAPYTPDYSDVATLIAETVSAERVTIQLANARLIAAAPELLAALQSIVKRIEFYTNMGDANQVNIEQWEYSEGSTDMANARAAIAKATGSAA